MVRGRLSFVLSTPSMICLIQRLSDAQVRVTEPPLIHLRLDRRAEVLELARAFRPTGLGRTGADGAQIRAARTHIHVESTRAMAFLEIPSSWRARILRRRPMETTSTPR